MAHFLRIRGNRRTRQNELSELFSMVNFEPNCVPQLRSKLPLVDETRRGAPQQFKRSDLRKANVLRLGARVLQVYRTLSKPLACSGLAAPLSPLDQNGAFRSYTFLSNGSYILGRYSRILDPQFTPYRRIT